MTRLQEIEKLIDDNLSIVNEYTHRAAELMQFLQPAQTAKKRL